MGQFEATLQREIEGAQRSLTAALHVGDTGGFELHRARLRDLLDVATRSEVNTAGWISPSVRPLLGAD